jgi:uncharacterized protein YggE
MKRIVVAAAAALLVLAATAAVMRPDGAAAVDATETSGITVQGSASVISSPDTATLSFGVETSADSARAALAANGTEMRRFFAAVKDAGATNVQTQSVSLSPRYGNGDAVTGYIAQNSISATVKDLGRAGTIIDAAVDAGANQVSGPSLSASDQATLYRQALKAAVDDARARARALADGANATLGRVTQVVESGSAPAPLPMAEGKTADVTPIEPGTQEIQANVTVTFAIG